MERNRPLAQTASAKRVLGRILSWGREHVLAASIILAIPLAVGAFFWSRGTPEISTVPDYLSDIPNGPYESGDNAQSKLEEAAVISGAPDGSLILESPGRLHLGADAEFLPPLPASAETLKLIEKATQPACVWLTGKIEPVDAAAELIQHASRVHELTKPARQ
jgi:hypothetical protein